MSDDLYVDRGVAHFRPRGKSTLVDRFLAIEQWAQRSQRMVTVAMVLSETHRHPQKFGVKVARDFGLAMDVFSSESDAIRWLASARASRRRTVRCHPSRMASGSSNATNFQQHGKGIR